MSLQNRQTDNTMQYTFARLHTEHSNVTQHEYGITKESGGIWAHCIYPWVQRGSLHCIHPRTQGNIRNMNFLKYKGQTFSLGCAPAPNISNYEITFPVLQD